MPDKIKFPKKPKGINDLTRFPSLKANWEYSHSVLHKLHEKLNSEISNENLAIVVAGSYGRLDASKESDLDFMVLTDHVDESVQKAKDKLLELAPHLDIKLPNPTGVFSKIIPVKEMIEKTGSGNDNLDTLAQRMLLLMESKAIYNEQYFRNIVDRLLHKYLKLLETDPEKEALFFLNDIIRYFRFICVNYEFNFWKQEDKWVIRNVKLRHSRIIMYAGLLFLILNASKFRDERKTKFSYIAENIYLTPLEKILHVYHDNNDPSYSRILGIYDIFLRKISDSNIRASLRADYEERYSNPYYAEMKVNSDSLQTELTRFIFSRRGIWTDQIFEYLIF